MTDFDTLSEVAGILFGAGADELVTAVSKAAGVDQKHSKVGQQAALAGNAVAITGGAHALALSAGHLRNQYVNPEKRAASKAKRAARLNKIPGYAKTGATRAKIAEKIAANPGAAKKIALASGVGWLGLHGIELGADLEARRAMKQNYRNQGNFSKMDPGSSDLHIPSPGRLKRAAAKKAYEVAKPEVKRAGHAVLNSVPSIQQHPVRVARRQDVKKDAGFTFEGEFSKVDADKRQVFGWASIVELNGEPVVDLQGDYIDINEIEKSAYDYVIKSRKGGEMHRRSDDGQPVHASDMIESFIVTPEKIEKMGLPKSTPIGWWVGFKVNDDAAWNLVKSGSRTSFSIHGRGQRTNDFV